ncbi:MAG TPA: helix-turn-helix transcriptional regulator [Kribbellaceae bacterium]|nr:helix-turn-helix transcriptional regulator [Kribbellaceae bacterium]
MLGLIAEGRSNAAIADRLVVSGKTVESHIANIFTKLGLHDAPDDHRRVLAVLTALRHVPDQRP